jgi:hypothetical protein
MRRLHAALAVRVEKAPERMRHRAAQVYLAHLDAMIQHSPLGAQDRAVASEADPQGLGFARRKGHPSFIPDPAGNAIASAARGKHVGREKP